MRTTFAAAPTEAVATLWRCGSRQCGAGECEHEGGELHRHASGTGPTVAPPIVHQVLASPGSPLGGCTRQGMERHLGHSFADVRIHTDSRAAESAAAVGADAYTVGRQLVFGTGSFDPGSASGRTLLAHELTHAADAGPGARPGLGRLRVSSPEEPAERRAEQQSRHLGASPWRATDGDAHCHY